MVKVKGHVGRGQIRVANKGRRARNNVKLHGYGTLYFQFNEAIACIIGKLQEDKEDGWLWSSLGEIYQRNSGIPKASSLATSCFKQAVKLSGKVSKLVSTWHFLGPFVIGKNEVDGDPLEAYGGIVNASRERHNKKFKAFSELLPGGALSWSSIPSGSALEPVRIVPQVNWNDLIRQFFYLVLANSVRQILPLGIVLLPRKGLSTFL